jgi:hypothetical protein
MSGVSVSRGEVSKADNCCFDVTKIGLRVTLIGHLKGAGDKTPDNPTHSLMNRLP